MRIRQRFARPSGTAAILIAWGCAVVCPEVSGQPLPQSSQATAAPAGTISLSELLSRAAQHPDVMAAQADIAAAQGGVVAADRAPLPQVSASLASIDLQNGIGAGSVMGSKRLEKGVGLDWTWERGDKRVLRTRSADWSLQAAQFDRIEILVQRRLAIASAYWDLLAAQEREEVSSDSLRSAQQLAASSRIRFEKGDISEQELARLLIETERARSELAAARVAREIAAITLAQSAGTAPTGLYAERRWPELPDSLKQASGQVSELAQVRPDVQAALTRSKAARAALDLARSLQTTDITWGVGFSNYPPDQRAMLQLRAQFPWQINYQYEGEIRQAAAASQRAEELLRQTTQGALAEMLALDLRRIRTAERLAAFESEIRARARRVLERAEAAYARGATPLTELLDARRTHLSVEFDAVQARADAARALTEWQLRIEGLERLPNRP